jgi:hypothetical protein
MCLRVSYKKHMIEKNLFASLKSLKKVVGFGVRSGSGFVSQSYGSADPDLHQNATDPQHCSSQCLVRFSKNFLIYSKYLFRGGKTEEGEVVTRCGRGEVSLQEAQKQQQCQLSLSSSG